jgi:hypothetical protein
MFSAYRCLLHLYPAPHRVEFGDEMLAVFHEARAEASEKGLLVRAAFYARELKGLLIGAFNERVRSITGSRSWELFPSRRFTMRSEFRFPKSAPLLMALILAGTVLAIEKATAIRASVPDVNPHVGPIQPAHFTFFPALLVIFTGAYLAGVIGWAILFALHRSGFHRLTEMATPKQE